MRTYTVVLMYLAIFAGITAFVQSQPTVGKQAHKPPLIMGVFPRFHHDITIESFTPLAKYLSDKLDRRVKLVSSQSFASFWKDLQARKFDIVHYNQYHYIATKDKLDYEVVVMNEERGRSTISSSIVIRKDSGIESIQDLKGKTILFGGGQKAMISYIYARYLLLQGGLRPDDYKVRFESNPPSALIAASHNLWNAKAAGVGDVVLKLPGIKKFIKTEDMRYLAVGDQYAHLPWAVKQELDPALKQRIQQVLLDLKNAKDGKKILKKARLTGFAKAKDSDFDPHRRITMETLGENYFTP